MILFSVATQKKKTLITFRSVRTRWMRYPCHSTTITRIGGACLEEALPRNPSLRLTIPLFPPRQSRKQEFIESLLKFIHESPFSAALFLAGVDMSNRTDAQMTFVLSFVFFFLVVADNELTSTPNYYIHPPNSPPWDDSPLSSISQLPIPEYTSPVAQYPGSGGTPQNEGPIPFIPGGGLTRRILSSLPPTSWSVPTGALVQFVLEGDNRSDASLMAAVVARILSLQVKQWQQPSSWRQGLFGTPHDQTLYG
jgi:proteasome assembly chaperone 2